MCDYSVEIDHRVYEAVEETYNYILYELKAPAAAERVYHTIISAIDSLSYMPDRIKLMDSEPWHTMGYRKLLVKNFYLFFTVDDSNHTVYVFELLYARSDIDKRLSDMK